MIECEKCKYENNPPTELNCLYCKEKLNTVEVLAKGLFHYNKFSDALSHLNAFPLTKIGELTVTEQKHMLYNAIYNKDIIIRLRPDKFSKTYYDNGWFDVANSLPPDYSIRSVSQTRKDIILVFLRRNG